MGNEHLRGRPDRVPTLPKVTSAEGCPLVAEIAGMPCLALLLIHWGSWASKSLKVSGLLFLFSGK